jgi:hypothetical protein
MPAVSVELCGLARNLGKIPIFEDFIKNIRKSGKIPTKCPLQPVTIKRNSKL